MFSWGENCQQGFRLKAGTETSTADGVHFLNLSFQIRDLSVGHSVLAFIKTNGDAFIIRTYEDNDGRRCRRKQKFVDCQTKLQAVSCGDDEVTLLSETGAVLCVDTTKDSFTPSTPHALFQIPVCQVACGSQHSIALTKEGQVYIWGQDSRGQLGLGKIIIKDTRSPQHLRSLSDVPVVQIAAGGEQSFALSVSGGVFGWGRNDCGQLGLGDTADRSTPTSVHFLNTKKTIRISCGKAHTATLSKHGAVFTFGSGRYGQLRHNSYRDELRPRLVAELWGAKVTRIACGRRHTLVLTDSKRIYSFGCGEQGQLGHGEAGHPFVPLRVHLQDPPDGKTVGNIYAGENCSFAACPSNEDDHAGPNTDTKQEFIEDMINNWTIKNPSKSSWKKSKVEIHRMFSSASCVNRSFLDRRKDKHFQTSSRCSGLDLSLAREKLEELVRNNEVLKKVETAALRLLPSLDKNPVGVEGLRVYLLLNELLHATQKHDGKQSTELAVAAAAALQKLSAANLQIIEGWWSSLSASTLVKYVHVWKQALSCLLSSEPVPRSPDVVSGVKNLLLLLQLLYHANNSKTGRQKISEKTFGLGINQELLIDDLNLWWLQKNPNMNMNQQPLILHKFPFLMNLNSKKMVFDLHVTWTQEEHQKVLMPPSGLVAYTGSQFFELKLRRDSLLGDTFQQLAAARHSDYKKPLVVYFDGDTKVTDVYKRDFFHRLFGEMLFADSRMFMFNDSGTLAWFSSRAATEDRTQFFLFGLLCGLALYNQSIINLPFPLALFKKLLDIKPTLEDLMDFSPSVGESLTCILDYEDDVLEDLDMCFLISWDGTDVDLDPQNPEKPVTSQNKKEFVDAYVNHVFNTSVEGVFQEFRRGFFQVCDPDMVKLFRPEELQGVLVGQEVYDWAKLKQNTIYDWVYVGHPTIQMFWEVFDDLDEEQRKDFLWFLTGFRRVPILGMEQIQMKVRVKQIESGSHDQHFPESLTCHSILDLPLYSTKKIMRSRLTQALMSKNGFLT